jgi:hypothetical protein
MDISSEVRKDVRKNGNKLPIPELNAIKNEYRNRPLGGVEQEPEDQSTTLSNVTSGPALDFTSGPTLSNVTSGPVLDFTSGPTLSNVTSGPVLPSSVPAAKPIDPSLLGSNPMSIMKNLQIAQGTK